MDGDGDPDIISGENGRGSFDGTEETAVWENISNGSSWVKHIVATGMESHHGSRVFDLDGDGDYEIISIGFDDKAHVNLWRNDAAPAVVAVLQIERMHGINSLSMKMPRLVLARHGLMICTPIGNSIKRYYDLYGKKAAKH